MPRVRREAEVTWEGNVARGSGAISAATGAFEGGSHRIVASELLARARVKELDGPALQLVAERSSAGCTMSALIEASATVTVNATLEGGTDGD